MRGQKGITLVALIITIIVLLILAVVAISAVSEGGILGHAKNAQQTYKEAANNESVILNGYQQYLTNEVRDAQINATRAQ